MPSNLLTNNANIYLKKLCLEIPTQRVGTKGNQAATDFFASIVSSFGFETESPVFEFINWVQPGAEAQSDNPLRLCDFAVEKNSQWENIQYGIQCIH